MKRLPLMIALLCTAPLLHAEGMYPPEAPPQDRGRGMERMGPPPEERLLSALTEVLGLSEAQAKEVSTLLRDDRETRRQEMEMARRGRQQKVEQLLDERQVALFRAFMRGFEAGRPPHAPGMPQRPSGQRPSPETGAYPW